VIVAGVHRASSIKIAEAAKVIENTQRDLNIALMNELAIIFGKIGIDTHEVLEAARTKWNFLPFHPGLVGGHCIGVDPYYLTHKAEMLGYHPQVILAGRRINDNMARYAARSVVKKMLQNGMDVARSTVGVLGITFKENCPDIRNSKVIDMVRELQTWGCQVVVVDSWADPVELKNEYGIELGIIDSKNQVDALVVAVTHDEFRHQTPQQLRQFCKTSSPVLGDIKSLYNYHEAVAAGFTVFRF
jgi:UDP-N-acetyl-D-galactosamine dehydrogenase